LSERPVVSGGADYSGKWTAFAAIAAGQFVGVVDLSAVGVALPGLADDLGLSLSQASWVVLAATLTISAVLLPVGGLSDAVGRKRMFVAGGVLFGVGAAGAVVAPSLAVLIAARVVQSVGSAIIVVNGYAIVSIAFPPEERGKGIGSFTTVVGLGAIMGPMIGGGLAEAFGWRSVFVMLAAGGVVATALAWRLLDSRRYRAERSVSTGGFDWAGAVLSAGALILFISALNEGGTLGWGSPLMLGAWVGAAALSGAFVWRELAAARPMLDVRMFADRAFRWASTTRFIGFVAGTGTLRLLMPFYLQDLRGYGADTVGLVMVPWAVGMAVFSSVSGRLSDRFGVRVFTMTGLAMTTGSMAVLATLTERSSLYLIVPILFMNGSGLGFWDAPNATRALSAVRASSFSAASAVVNLTRNTGEVVAVALAAAIVSGMVFARGFEPDLSLIGEESTGRMATAFLTGARIAYLVPVGVGLVALFAAFRTPDPRGAG